METTPVTRGGLSICLFSGGRRMLQQGEHPWCAGDEMQSGHLRRKVFENPCLLFNMSNLPYYLAWSKPSQLKLRTTCCRENFGCSWPPSIQSIIRARFPKVGEKL